MVRWGAFLSNPVQFAAFRVCVIGKSRAGLGRVLTDVLEQPGRVRPHFQPIVDLQRGEVCGYEALARFTDWPGVPPCDVFAAADDQGMGGALEAQMVREVLEARPHVAADRFLSVNLSPRAVHERRGAGGVRRAPTGSTP